jgi:CBS domain-containing protein
MTTLKPQLMAADLMTIDPVIVSFDAPIEEAERLIRDHRVSGLPVVDENGVWWASSARPISSTSITLTFAA